MINWTLQNNLIKPQILKRIKSVLNCQDENILFVVAILFINLIPLSIYGCQCQGENVTYRFVDDLINYEFIGVVEILGKDTVRGDYNSYSLTKVKVITQFSKKYSGQELEIIDAKGSECFVRLWYKDIGDKVAIKGYFGGLLNQLNIPDSLDRKVLYLDLCDKNQLRIKNNKVYGNITVNKFQRRWKWNEFVKKLSFGHIDGNKKRKEFLPQEFGFEKFCRLIRDKLKE